MRIVSWGPMILAAGLVAVVVGQDAWRSPDGQITYAAPSHELTKIKPGEGDPPTDDEIVVFNNFGPNGEYTTNVGFTIGLSDNLEQGNAFTPSDSGTLAFLEVAIGYVRPVNATTIFTLYADDGNGLPGAVLEDWKFAVPGRFGGNNAPIKLISSVKPVLNSGVEYHVIAAAPGWQNGDWLAFNKNNQGDEGGRIIRRNGGAWSRSQSTRAAMRVTSNSGGGCDPCDANCDGSVDLTDVEPFIKLLLGEDPCAFCAGDTNGDGSIDLTDVEGFIECLLG